MRGEDDPKTTPLPAVEVPGAREAPAPEQWGDEPWPIEPPQYLEVYLCHCAVRRRRGRHGRFSCRGCNGALEKICVPEGYLPPLPPPPHYAFPWFSHLSGLIQEGPSGADDALR